jgi:hypothetical protein
LAYLRYFAKQEGGPLVQGYESSPGAGTVPVSDEEEQSLDDIERDLKDNERAEYNHHGNLFAVTTYGEVSEGQPSLLQHARLRSTSCAEDSLRDRLRSCRVEMSDDW